ncbi:hypothetical protein [Flagellimonas nanhaiensis]|uniref:Uncharacterized protein n=1 Tax=Flagellimonas nanhaiensis TaxID=2292706 RepID=A0A371JKS4_9FLAO|nr:hypothetical protein [Allomuricauda nanhaiensis]RDY57565.1 hypothetical protein DX873_18575 [Allomuricauda nanhaiensis]
MAKKGNLSAFTQVGPTPDNLSDDLKFWANLDFQKKVQAETSRERALERRRRDTEDRNKRIANYTKGLKNYDTGSNSLNEAQGRLILEAAEQIGDIAIRLEDPDIGIEERVRLNNRLSNLNMLPEHMRAFTGGITQRHEEIMKGVADGKVWENEKLDRYKSYFDGDDSVWGKMQFALDDKGLPAIIYRDIDGDGIADAEGYDQISQAISAFGFDPKVDANEIAGNIAKSLGEDSTTTSGPGFSTNFEQGPRADDIELQVQEAIQEKNGGLKLLGKSMLVEMGLEDSLENRQLMVDRLRELVNSKVDRTSKETINFGARNAANRLAQEGLKKNSNKKVVISAIKGLDGITSTNAEVQDFEFDSNGKLKLKVSVPKTKSITKNDFSELEAKAADGDENAQQQLELAQLTGDGGAKVIIPGENEARTIVVQDEDVDWVSDRLGIDKNERKATKTNGIDNDSFNEFLRKNNLQ